MRRTIAAAVDIGSNSAHLLVASVGDDGGLDPLADESVFLGLGERAATAGHLGPELRRIVIEALGRYAGRARELGAASDRIVLIGTEPIRRAGDGARLVTEVGRELGLPLVVADHEEEGLLTLLGVLGGRPVVTPTAVVDSGGGSTEVVLASPDGRHAAHGIRLGSVSLATAHIRSDPPTRAAYEAMRREAGRAFAPVAVGDVGAAIAVGGSASNLAKVIPGALADRTLTPERLATVLDELLATPAAALVERYGLNPRRAPLMVAGLAVVDALIESLGAPELRVLEEGIREGAILAVARAGTGWRDALPRLATGWSETRG